MAGFKDFVLPELAVGRVIGLFGAVVPACGNPWPAEFRRLVRNPAFENLSDDGPIRVVWVREVDPVS